MSRKVSGLGATRRLLLLILICPVIVIAKAYPGLATTDTSNGAGSQRRRQPEMLDLSTQSGISSNGNFGQGTSADSRNPTAGFPANPTTTPAPPSGSRAKTKQPFHVLATDVEYFAFDDQSEESTHADGFTGNGTKHGESVTHVHVAEAVKSMNINAHAFN